ncbi:MAG: hypothetical protein ACRDA3_01775 [Peptostreptococcaceae bacterium]
MKLKRILAGIVAISFFVVGCTSVKIESKNSVDQEAIYQETMTKVQNDVSEILNRDYEYVINNMGLPYCTTYYIDLDDIKGEDILAENYSVKNMRLVYPKDTSDNKLKGSALYIDIEDNKVLEVQTYELSDYNKEIEKPNDEFDITLNKYSEEVNLSIEQINNVDLESYIGQKDENIKEGLDNIRPNFEAFEFKTDKKLKIYTLNDLQEKDGKLLMVYEQQGVVKDIFTTSNNIVELVKNYLYKK